MYNVMVQSYGFTDSKALSVGKVLLGSFLIALSAQVSIPFYPVPMTLQPEAILLTGLLCSPALAFSITSAYLVEALVGLPVLQGFKGGMQTFGTTGGYVFGFILMATLISWMSHKTSSLSIKIIACLVGYTVLFGCGIGWLSQFIGMEKAVVLGLYPFLPKVPLTIGVGIVAYKIIHTFKGGGDKNHGNGL